ncbi:MAG: VOC family protein [Actinomycetales bacterium]
MHLELTLDVNDPETMIEFWAALLDYESPSEPRFEVTERIYWSLVPRNADGPRLVIQRVPEPTVGKSRLHLDIHVSDIEAEATRACTLGALRIDHAPITEVGSTWIRMQDPEGNLFCLVAAS